MHLIATGGGADVADNTNDEPVVNVPTDEESHQEPAEEISAVSYTHLTLPTICSV